MHIPEKAPDWPLYGGLSLNPYAFRLIRSNPGPTIRQVRPCQTDPRFKAVSRKGAESFPANKAAGPSQNPRAPLQLRRMASPKPLRIPTIDPKHANFKLDV